MLQVSHLEEQVERNIVRLKDRQAAEHVRSQNEIVVGLVVREVSHPDELAMARELQQLLLTRWRCQVDPTHQRSDEIVPFRQAERPAILRQVMLRLHDDRLVDTRFPD